MAIRKKLDEQDIAVLEIVEDPIWLPEFLRNTADGEPDKNLHPPMRWRHRDYQRQLLSDRSKYISLTGGRAIGKCEPAGANILVASEGYQKLGELAKRKSFITYALTPQGTLEQRRARAVPDKYRRIYHITSQSGHHIAVTANHPVLTERGWIEAKDLEQGNLIAVATALPHESTNNALRWHELRWLGYVYLAPRPIKLGVPFKPRWKRSAKEYEIIAERFSSILHKTPEGEYSLHNHRGPLTSPITALYIELDLDKYTEWGAQPKYLPEILMKENNDNTKIFLEALFSQYAELSPRQVKIVVKYKKIAEQVQELLLRHSIESKIYNKGKDEWTVELLDYEEVYNFFATFNLPGVGLGQLPKPQEKVKPTEFMRFEPIVEIRLTARRQPTFAIYVYEDNNYISGNIFVHNTVILEDKIVYETINYDLEFPVTPEQVLTTANQAQMTPLLGKLIQRFTMSKFLAPFLRGNINKAEGTMIFPIRQKPFTFYFRIAGSKGENNVVGLHLPRIKIDEAQIYPPKAFTQLMPTLNH